MNKYIRTKDAVYEVDENDIDEKIRIFSLYSYEIYSDLKFNALILNQADTIKELCDGFYLDLGGEFDDTYLRRKDKFEFLKSLALDYIRKGKQVNLYGFIKTSKGLIYVAKINEEGELELL